MEQSQIILKKYWQLVKLLSTGKTTIQEISLAKEFINKQIFPITYQKVIDDKVIQTELLQLFSGNSDTLTKENNDSFKAQICLRCFISHQIQQVCIQLEFQFGKQHGFDKYDLFPFVLNDTLEDLRKNKPTNSNYKPLSLEILEIFESEKSTLSTWITRIVKQNRELNTFLLEQGVYLISNWAILNDTTPKQLGKILAEFYHCTPTEIEQASLLLINYHSVYRQDRLQKRTSLKAKCQPPSFSQLERIAHFLQQKTKLLFSPEDILFQLQQLAELLRQYRIYVRSGKLFNQQSWDDKDKNIDKLQSSLIESESDDENEEQEFSQIYRQQFVSCLRESIKLVLENRVNKLNRKNPLKAKQFLTALELFHCQGKSMAEIAPIVDLKAQYQVTRLLKLKEFRADIRQNMLTKLRDFTKVKASQYVDSSELQQLEQKIETALNEQITEIMKVAEIESNIANNTSANSVLITNLCNCLARLKD
jgi:hypothetical protein